MRRNEISLCVALASLLLLATACDDDEPFDTASDTADTAANPGDTANSGNSGNTGECTLTAGCTAFDCPEAHRCIGGTCVADTDTSSDTADDTNTDTSSSADTDANTDSNGDTDSLDDDDNDDDDFGDTSDTDTDGDTSDTSGDTTDSDTNTDTSDTSASNDDDDTTPPEPVDCSPIAANTDWQLCSSTDDECRAVFTDKAGCNALCAAANLTCAGVFENIDDACAPDTTRAELTCTPDSNHASDYCVCKRPNECQPNCTAKTCGPNGCGQLCGTCADSEACIDGTCKLTNAPADEDCTTYPFKASTLLAERVGFGRNTTGGDPNNLYRVTTLAASGAGSLKDALESDEDYWIVFDVEGTIKLSRGSNGEPTRIRVKSNKTIDGRGRDIKVANVQFDIVPGVKNVIFSDIEIFIENPVDNQGDLISMRGNVSNDPDTADTRNCWFHHLDLHHGGDGALDNRGATNITISWLHIHDHTKVMLHTKDTDNIEATHQRITYHHNWFDTTTRRGPHFAYGLADFFNNWQFHFYEYGANSIDEAQFLSEANIYEARPGTFCLPACPDPSPHGGGNDLTASKKALVNDWAPDKTNGYVKSVNDLLLNGATAVSASPNKVFNRADHYNATPEPANDALKTKLQNGTGPRVNYCKSP